MPRQSNKRQRLQQAARQVFYEQGYASTTLADIASSAQVPLGNVYYYYKTKESILNSVLESHAETLAQLFKELDQRPDPADRLQGFLARAGANAENVARYGCPHGSLLQELEKGQQERQAERMLHLQLAWMSQQFHAMGYPETAHELALELICATQGTCVVTHAIGDPDILRGRFKKLGEWIESLRRPSKS